MKKWLSQLLGPREGIPAPVIITAPALRALPLAPVPNRNTRKLLDLDGLFYSWLLDVESRGADELNAAEKRFLRALERMSEADDATVEELVPRMPAVIPLLLQSLRDKEISNAELAEQISQDVVLVAAVLRQANSSYYRRQTPITGIEQALTILGQNGLRLLVASVAFKPVINAQSGHFTKLATPRIWDLSSKCTIACRCMAAQRHTDAFEPFLAALVRNAGMVVALRVMDRVYDGAGLLQSNRFCTAFAQHAQMLACHVGRQWGFPENVMYAISEELTPATLTSGSPVGQVLYLSERLSKIRLMVNNERLDDAEADACIAEDAIEGYDKCYRELVASEDNPDS